MAGSIGAKKAQVNPPHRIMAMQPFQARRWMATVCLAVLLGCELAAFRASEFRGRWGALVALGAMPADEARLHGSSFGFDRRLGWFLDGVAAATPLSATVALPFVSPEGTPRTFAAAYLLAPRRVVDFSRLNEADYAAAPRGIALPGRWIPIPFGGLARLR
jgi:hypothetical protein